MFSPFTAIPETRRNATRRHEVSQSVQDDRVECAEFMDTNKILSALKDEREIEAEKRVAAGVAHLSAAYSF